MPTQGENDDVSPCPKHPWQPPRARLRQEATVRARIPKIAVRGRVLVAIMLFELVRVVHFPNFAMSRAHRLWSDALWEEAWRISLKSLKMSWRAILHSQSFWARVSELGLLHVSSLLFKSLSTFYFITWENCSLNALKARVQEWRIYWSKIQQTLWAYYWP